MTISGVRTNLWRAVDDESAFPEVLVQRRRNRAAAVKFLRRILKSTESRPQCIIAYGLNACRTDA